MNTRGYEVVAVWPQWGPFLERIGNDHEFLYGVSFGFRDRMAEKSTVLGPARPVFNRRYRVRQLLRRCIPLVGNSELSRLLGRWAVVTAKVRKLYLQPGRPRLRK